MFVNLQAFLDPLAALLDFDSLVAEGRACAVPETLPGILQHGASDMLGVLGAVQGVGGSDDSLGKVRRRPGTEVLGYRELPGSSK